MPWRRFPTLARWVAALLMIVSGPSVALADAVLFHTGTHDTLQATVGSADLPLNHADGCQLASHQGHSTPEATLVVTAVASLDWQASPFPGGTVPGAEPSTRPPARAPPLA